MTGRTGSDAAHDWLTGLRREQQSRQLIGGVCCLEGRRIAEDLPWA
jgi:hypothetical protein